MEYVGSFNQFSLRSSVAGCWKEAEINPLFWAWWHELCKPLTISGELQTIQKYSAMYYLLSKDAQAERNDPKMRPSLKSLHKWLSICWSTLMKKASLGFLGLCTVRITVMGRTIYGVYGPILKLWWHSTELWYENTAVFMGKLPLTQNFSSKAINLCTSLL